MNSVCTYSGMGRIGPNGVLPTTPSSAVDFADYAVINPLQVELILVITSLDRASIIIILQVCQAAWEPSGLAVWLVDCGAVIAGTWTNQAT